MTLEYPRIIRRNEMKHALITIGDYDILNQYEISFHGFRKEDAIKETIDEKWNRLMAPRGFALSDKKDLLKDLFTLICAEFETTYNEKIPITLREGYITKNRGHQSVRHNDTSRIFSTPNNVYIDLLMSSVLFDYAATSYLWARYADQEDIKSECFKQMFYNFDALCRKGMFANVEGSLHLFNLLNLNSENWELGFIGDLYWCMISFAVCHEVSHIYLRHNIPKDTTEAHMQEFQADQVGYEIYLSLMMKYKDSSEDKEYSVFREYLYAAPMILLLFYHNLFSMSYWLFGETIGNSHPPLMKRIGKLLEISQSCKYDFNTTDGNIVLNNYWDVSEQFIGSLCNKLKAGKLQEIIRKGDSDMKGNGFEQAFALDEAICKRIREFADAKGYNADHLIGIWNVAAQTTAESFGDQLGLVYSISGKKYSIKVPNIIYNQKVLIEFILDMGLTITKPDNPIATVQMALFIVYKIALAATIEISELQAKTLLYCHKRNAYIMPISEDTILKDNPDINNDVLTSLAQMGCVRIENGFVYLLEKVVLTQSEY